ncbi:MAG: hypothetical protein M4D80_17805 [Myxococcota bacterium]|nr:hypothetical protein [Myxococcota bacterium]
MKTVALAVLLAASPAFAEPTIELVPTCVAIDTELDQLPEAERPAARLLLVRALERLDQLIVETGCQDTITVSHQRDGESLHVRLANAHARRKLTVSVRDEMLEIYARMGKTLIEASAPAPAPPAAALDPIEDYTAAAPAIETPAVTAFEAEPPAQLKPGTWYAQFGLGVHDSEGGKGFAFGYRYGHRYKLDLGMSITGSDASMTTALRGQVLKHKTPDARTSVYYGMGLSYASTEMTMSDSSGARIESTVGVELGRSRSSRFYLESNLSVPLYDVAGNYPVAFVASFGVGL